MTTKITNLIPNCTCAGIYRLTNTTGQYYIGSSNNIKARVRTHLRLLKLNKHTNQLLQRAHNLSPNWLCERLDECLQEDLTRVEQAYLDQSVKDPRCLNLIFVAGKYPGSNHKWTEERRKAKSKEQFGKKRGPYRPRSSEHSLAISLGNKGKKRKPLSESHRTNISKARLGKKLSDEHKKNISLATVGRAPWNKGKKLTPEHIQKRQLSRYSS